MTLDLAQSYTARSWPVFPCRSAEEIDPSTGEILGVKTPYTPNGWRGASKRENILRVWWERNPSAMVGIPTGEAIGAWVLDIDVKGNGFATLGDLVAEHGPLPHTLRATTPSGGEHIYFRHAAGVRNRGSLGLGIDVRGDGGYVIAPGSQTEDGRSYKWVDPDAPLADAPQWLLDLVVRKAPEPSTSPVAATRAESNDRYVEAAVQRELDDLASTPMGNRNNRLNDASFNIGQFVGAGAITESQARAWLEAVARSWGRDWPRCVKTINNGLSAGIRHPRDIPAPKTRDDDILQHVDISRLLARARAEQAPSLPSAAEDTGEEKAAATEAPKPVVSATPFQWKEPSTLPRRDFVYGTHLVRKYVSVTVSPGGLGKTSNSIVEALAMVTGKALLGVPIPKPLRVWLFNAEDPRDEMERRIIGAMLHYGITPEDIGGRLYLDTGREQDIVIAYEKRGTIEIAVPIVDSVVGQIKANGIDVFIGDPFVSTHGVNENDNGAIDKVAKLWAKIADETNSAVELVHHVRKTDGREVTVDDARGAVALLAAARSARVLNRMSDEQANEAGVPRADRFEYFNVQRGKANLSRMNGDAEWRRLVSVGLGNTEGLQKPQDHVGVVTEWQWPGREALLEAVSGEAVEIIKVRLNSGSYRYANQARQAEPWAGEVLAEVLNMDVDGDKRRITNLIEAWLKDGTLVKEQIKETGGKGVKRPYIKGAGWVNFAA